MRGLVVDLFAGGGGASTGIEAALGRPVDIAINHDAIALAVHKANHPETRHLDADIWEVKPAEATGGRPVSLLWASPDCTHFSVAKGDVPRRQEIRSLAWAVVRWAAAVRPAVIILENVSEFRTWGPLGKDGRPVKRRMGVTFLRWKGKLEKLGYRVDFQILDASLYGAPTKRRRLFIVARCDGQPIRWPQPTHGPGRLPLRTAAECIDWKLPCPSIFERERPLAEKTLWRIAQGIRRFVLENPRPFVIRTDHHQSHATNAFDPEQPLGTITSANGHAVVLPALMKFRGDSPGAPIDAPAPTLTAGGKPRPKRPATGNPIGLLAPTLIQTGFGEREGQAARVPGLDKPLGTAVAGGVKRALVSAFLAKHFGGHTTPGIPLTVPADTITAKDHHALAAATLVQFNHNNAPVDPEEPMHTVTSNNHLAEVRAFLTTYYSAGSVGQRASDPLRTVTSKHRLGLVTVEGTDYQIVDIGMRMLEPHELARAQFGRFADRIDLSAAKTKAKKVHLIGNSVCPEVAEAVVAANLQGESREAVA
jgi:DNA (cytosine-5)-methyltransferase 1